MLTYSFTFHVSRSHFQHRYFKAMKSKRTTSIDTINMIVSRFYVLILVAFVTAGSSTSTKVNLKRNRRLLNNIFNHTIRHDDVKTPSDKNLSSQLEELINSNISNLEQSSHDGSENNNNYDENESVLQQQRRLGTGVKRSKSKNSHDNFILENEIMGNFFDKLMMSIKTNVRGEVNFIVFLSTLFPNCVHP
jgi:hypothetical protein